MTTPEYAWITHAWFYEDFWTTRYYQNRSLYEPVNNCTDEDMMRIANQIFVIDHYPMHENEDTSEFIGGLVSSLLSTGTGGVPLGQIRDIVISLAS